MALQQWVRSCPISHGIWTTLEGWSLKSVTSRSHFKTEKKWSQPEKIPQFLPKWKLFSQWLFTSKQTNKKLLSLQNVVFKSRAKWTFHPHLFTAKPQAWQKYLALPVSWYWICHPPLPLPWTNVKLILPVVIFCTTSSTIVVIEDDSVHVKNSEKGKHRLSQWGQCSRVSRRRDAKMLVVEPTEADAHLPWAWRCFSIHFC